jgi:hypothetical protein
MIRECNGFRMHEGRRTGKSEMDLGPHPRALAMRLPDPEAYEICNRCMNGLFGTIRNCTSTGMSGQNADTA